jgi:hypothetical protein
MKGSTIVLIAAAGAYLLLAGKGKDGEGGTGGSLDLPLPAIFETAPAPAVIENSFVPSQYLTDLIAQKNSTPKKSTHVATSVATSQYKYGDQLGSIGDGSTNAFDAIAATIPKNIGQGTKYSTEKKVTNLGSWGSSGMSKLMTSTSAPPTPPTPPKLSELQRKMGVVLK